MLKDWIARGCLVAALNAGCPAWAVSAEAPSDPQLDRAELLIDSDYGDRRVLDDAAQLVSQSLARAPSARAYTQAAQIVIRGGHVVSERFQPGTQNLYRILIDRALAIDPQYAPALSLLFDAQLLVGWSARLATSRRRAWRQIRTTRGCTSRWPAVTCACSTRRLR